MAPAPVIGLNGLGVAPESQMTFLCLYMGLT